MGAVAGWMPEAHRGWMDALGQERREAIARRPSIHHSIHRLYRWTDSSAPPSNRMRSPCFEPTASSGPAQSRACNGRNQGMHAHAPSSRNASFHAARRPFGGRSRRRGDSWEHPNEEEERNPKHPNTTHPSNSCDDLLLFKPFFLKRCCLSPTYHQSINTPDHNPTTPDPNTIHHQSLHFTSPCSASSCLGAPAPSARWDSCAHTRTESPPAPPSAPPPAPAPRSPRSRTWSPPP